MKKNLLLFFTINLFITGILFGRDKSLDISDEFLGPQNQFTTPFCQSFAMIGLLEHYWFKKTKTHLKFSEKYMVKAILLTLAEKMWIESEQRFDTEAHQVFAVGGVGESIILEAVKGYGILPDTAYPSVVKEFDKYTFNLDLDKYNKFAQISPQELNKLGKTLNDVKKMIEDIFESPQGFSVIAEYFSYVDFSNHTIRLTSSNEIFQFIELKADELRVVFNKDGFLPGRSIFSLEDYADFRDIELYGGNYFVESHANEMISAIEQAIDLGVPVIFWNKWQKIINNQLDDVGGHATLIVGYQKTEDGRTWYRIKNSGGVNTSREERLIDGTTVPIIKEKGYSYFEKETLKTLLIAITIPSIFM